MVMDVLQENKNTVPTSQCKLELFFDQLAQQSTLRITDLNEDRLLEIFQIAQRIFRKGFCIDVFKISDFDVIPTNYLSCKRRSSHDRERIFKNFGRGLFGISISSSVAATIAIDLRTDFVLNLVSHQYVNKVESLKFECIEIHAVFTVKLKLIFKRLKLIVLDKVFTKCSKTLFADLNSLVELRVFNVHNCHAILENTFPKLERFSFAGSNNLLSIFILRHTSLQTINLYSHMDKRLCAEM